MSPLLHLDRFYSPDRDRVSWPEVDQTPFESPVFDQQFITTTGGIRPCPRTMKDNSSILDIRRLQPQRNAKRLVTSEVPLLGLDWFIPVELNSLSKFAGNQTIVPFQFCRGVCFGAIG